MDVVSDLRLSQLVVVTSAFHLATRPLVGSDRVVEDVQAVSPLRLEQPAQPPSAVLGKLQEKLPLMAAIRDMPDLSWDVMAVGSAIRSFSP